VVPPFEDEYGCSAPVRAVAVVVPMKRGCFMTWLWFAGGSQVVTREEKDPTTTVLIHEIRAPPDVRT